MTEAAGDEFVDFLIETGLPTNNPPAATLELNDRELRWLHAVLCKAEKHADLAFADVCSMSSSDPRAQHRVLLQAAANVDQVMSDQLASRLEKQHPTLERSSPGFFEGTEDDR